MFVLEHLEKNPTTDSQKYINILVSFFLEFFLNAKIFCLLWEC